ncbi:hypothetical protein D3C81_1837750 [compost metagenome]
MFSSVWYASRRWMLCSIRAYRPPINAVIIPSTSSVTPHHSGALPPSSDRDRIPSSPTFITTVENSAAAGALALACACGTQPCSGIIPASRPKPATPNSQMSAPSGSC